MSSREASTPRTASPSYKRARFDAAAEDRLSDLPECLLHDILSRLWSRQAVQTSVLSRRWRHLWRSTPVIVIDQRQFPGSDDRLSQERARFEDFGDGMLASADTKLPLYAFRLHLVDGWNLASQSQRWIRRGLMRCPATVDIHCNPADHSSVSVVLWPPVHVDMGTAARRLTRLTLSGISLRHGFGERLGTMCPVLESLHLDGCHHEPYAYDTINSPTLKNLVVCSRTRYSYSATATLAIAAPRLASLVLVAHFGVAGGNPVITAPGHDALASLVTASIDIRDRDQPNQRANKTKLEFLRSMCGFLARISNVRSLLILSGFTTTALLDQESQEFPVFQNLRTLVLRRCDVGAINSQVLIRILEGTPNLEKIGLHHCKFSGRPRRRGRKTKPKRTSSKQRFSALVQHKNLRLIQIKYQPDDQAHWDKIFEIKEMQQWRAVKKLYSVIPRGGEGSTAARNTPVRQITLTMCRLPIAMCNPVATTRRVQRSTSTQRRARRRVAEIESTPT